MRATTTVAGMLVGILGLASSCAPMARRFPLASPVWEDPDFNHVPRRPATYFSGATADFVDHAFFRKLSGLFAFPLPGEAHNVNAVDEVPNSSWFTNRIGLFPLSPERVARAACDRPPLDPARGPWVVTAAKPDGINPGFFIRAPSGRYLLKFDGPVQPQRATAADVIGSKIYWAAGYHTPCNEIVYFRRSILRIGKGAKAKNKLGQKAPLTEKLVDQVLRQGFRLKNGLIRAVASRLLPGRPLGPFRYHGTRSGDPNDVIPHENRRELRGARLLAAWLHHFDAREQNTLDLWVHQGGRYFVRHYKIDWGDCLGNRDHPWPGLSQRLGHTYALDWPDMFLDLVTLGSLPRPWYRARINTEAEIFGYYTSRDFVASKWKPEYPNPAFERMTFADALWMARIISRFSDAHLRAIVREARLTDPRAEAYLLRTLTERRDKILAEYFTRWAPLARFRLVRRRRGSAEQSLCFEDLALRHQVVAPASVLYKLRFFAGTGWKKELGWLQFAPDPQHPHRSCVVLPIGDRRPADLAPPRAPDDHPLRYGVLKIFIHQKPAVPPTSSVWLHFYDLGKQRGYRLVGIERQPAPAPPDIY